MAGKFVDNSKYFFLYCNKYCRNIRHIWLTDSKEIVQFLNSNGFECYHNKSWKGINFALRAKVFIYSSYITDVCNLAFTGGGFFFNLWHGIPLKKIEYDFTKGPLRYLYAPANLKGKLKRFSYSPPLTKKHDAVLTTSANLKKIFSSAFRVPEEKVLVAQYPRVTPFFWNEAELENHILNFENHSIRELLHTMKQFDHVWVYMPTWRDANLSFLTEALPDFEKLNTICRENKILFLIKTHIITEFNIDLSNFSNIKLTDRNVDMYPLLPFTTALVTDYSSIFFDYSLLKKRIIFYPFDLEEYNSGSREFYFDYNSIVKNREVVYSFQGLLQLLNNISDEKNDTKTQYNGFDYFTNTSSDFYAPVKFIKESIGLKDV